MSAQLPHGSFANPVQQFLKWSSLITVVIKNEKK
jgi:hypothetical protein